MWDREVPRLASAHQVIRFDLRGFGASTPASAPFSYVDDIHSLLNHLHAPPAYLVGSSMGGAFAIDFALAHPDRVRGLLLVAPGLSGGVEPPFTQEEEAALDYDQEKSKEVAQAWAAQNTPTAIERLRQLWCRALKGPPLALFRTMVEENLQEVFDDRSMKRATDAPPAAGRLPTLGVPSTILVGDQDNPSSVVFARRIAHSIRGARLATIPGADHLVNLSRPDAFDAALTEALGRVR